MMEISDVECVNIEKKNKEQVYVIEVRCQNHLNYEIYRNYTSFFALKETIKGVKAKSATNVEVNLPEIGLKWFKKVGKANEKKKKQINDFCKAVIKLPVEVSGSEAVQHFFRKWPSDLTDDSSAKKDSSSGGGKAQLRTSLSNEKSDNLLKELKLKTHSISLEAKDEASEGKQRKISTSNEHTSNQLSSQSTTKPHPPTALKPPMMTKILGRSDSSNSMDNKYIVTEDYNVNGSGGGKQGGVNSPSAELKLYAGNTVQVISKELTGWWLVYNEVTGEEGLAPGGILVPYDCDAHDEILEDQDALDLSGNSPVYEAISEYKAKTSDEVSYKKSEHVKVLTMRTDGWWKVRTSVGKVGLAPAMNLARISDGSGPDDALYSDITLYSQQSLYKRTPPKRDPSRVSLSEIYAKVEKKPQFQAAPSIAENLDDDDDSDYDTFDFQKKKPAVPPKNLAENETAVSDNKKGSTTAPARGGMPVTKVVNQDNYCEIEFKDPPPPDKKGSKLKIIGSDEKTDYMEINPGSLPAKAPKPKLAIEDHFYGNVEKENDNQYINVTRISIGPEEDKYYEVNKDYNPKTSHQEGLPAAKGDVVKCLKQETSRMLCLMCLLEDSDDKPNPREGWIAREYLNPVVVDVVDHDPHNVPLVRKVPEEDSTAIYADTHRPHNGVPKKISSWSSVHKKGEWFVGQMDRASCEELLKGAASHEFVVRESNRGNEDYSISVRYKDGVKHFKINKNGEGRYEIGGHAFKNLHSIIKHYKKNVLFVSDDGKSEILGKPYIVKKR